MPLHGITVYFNNPIEVPLVKIKERTASIDHPGQSEIGERSVLVCTSNVAVSTRKPALLEINRYAEQMSRRLPAESLKNLHLATSGSFGIYHNVGVNGPLYSSKAKAWKACLIPTQTSLDPS